DQCIDQRLAHRLENWLDAPLLGSLVGMIEVELVGELVQGSIEFGRRLPRPLRYVDKCLRSVHRRILTQLCADVRGELANASSTRSGVHGCGSTLAPSGPPYPPPWAISAFLACGGG